ncbi:hypothetical protein, partial [Rhodococcus opacus]|uniref:hypothetical protein n=1 Tax=Rhodococcus opacus TaxID=37919 RepID=UPI0019D6B85F
THYYPWDKTPVRSNKELIGKAIQRALDIGIHSIKFLFDLENESKWIGTCKPKVDVTAVI